MIRYISTDKRFSIFSFLFIFFSYTLKEAAKVLTLAIWLLCTTFISFSMAEKTTTVGFIVGISGLGDQSFNDMAYSGLMQAKQEHNLKLIYEDSEKSDIAFEASMQRLLEKGSDIIVANGFYLKDLVKQYSVRYPDTYFILQDAELTDIPNVVCITYSVHEGSFLAGALAGLMTKSNHVSYIGGVDIPIMHVFKHGFIEGIRYTNPVAQTSSMFISKAPDFSGFNNPEKGHAIALDLYSAKTDIIFSAAGLSGNGVLHAAQETGKYAIGVDSDQDHLAKGHVLTSMMKRLDIATYTEVSKIVQGKFKPGIVRYGLKEKGVGLSDMKFTRHLIPSTILQELAAIENKIISGELHVVHYLEDLDVKNNP